MKNLLSIIFISASCLLYSQDSLKQYKNSVGIEILGESSAHFGMFYTRKFYVLRSNSYFEIKIGFPFPVLTVRYNQKLINKFYFRASTGIGLGYASLLIPVNKHDDPDESFLEVDYKFSGAFLYDINKNYTVGVSWGYFIETLTYQNKKWQLPGIELKYNF